MDLAQFDSIRRYVGFDGETSALLRELHPLALPHIPAIIDDFYAAIERDADAMAVVTGGSEQITRLRRTLTEWLSSSLSGPHDLGKEEGNLKT